ncbi:hypothetical protein AOQ73_05815 [Bradyrhizobium pachyrhizi]|uniref:hypothetical protein n=1 Tax=Bradyrhizobium pachyrhizi TaxID=280333 RepID=UPI0007050CF8|nr:hypothetical protein [Bradyrhizobium pachyrhizi]KRQ11924.1 hypothetical protein AOQ73_05815 [Bradyrhizobium pachyrhizi]
MSYSFTVKAATKNEAKAAVAVEFDKVVATQPIHARDKAAALTNANAVIDLLADDAPDGHVINVSCNGYVGWRDNLRDDGGNPLNSASVSASAGYYTGT